LFLENQLQTDIYEPESSFKEIFEALDREADNLSIIYIVIWLEVDTLVSDIQ